MPAKIDERFMRAAIAEAQKGVGATSPNPAVGAVLVSKNKIISRGYHRRAGSAHAELECLANLGAQLPSPATLYVTLEPCSTVGRTGACTVAIINSGVRNLVIGALDPNPKHAGRGIEQLKKAGLDVRIGVLGDECAALNESY
jgi:diaminohydroxyphosphoribosylaminopyrimidine deaminase/5-amino-6-(5-phosphoribosylamino)uracil reductase